MASKYEEHFREVDAYYGLMYDDESKRGINIPRPGFTLDEVRLQEFYSNLHPRQVSLETKIGPIKLNVALMSAVMDTVCGPDLAKKMFEIGMVGVLDRTEDFEIQLNWLDDVLTHKPCLVSSPKCLSPDASIEKAEDIYKMHNFSTIPIVNNGILKGILFAGAIIWDKHRNEKVMNWMRPLKELTKIHPSTPFSEVKEYMLNHRKNDSVLPVVDDDGKFFGMYFTKDFINVNPATHNDKPVVGIAIGEKEEELEFAKQALKLGVSIIVVDSSHADCSEIINQCKKLVKLVDGQAAVIAGNYANIKGYLDLARTGVDAVKLGIGSGAICTTTQGTGIGKPMFTAIQESDFVRRDRQSKNKHAPVIIADGGINGSGQMLIALAAGAGACMAGKWLVPADESLSSKKNWTRDYPDGPYVKYRGMASKEAIDDRRAKRYDIGKTAPEGKSGYVKARGPIKKWIIKDFELVRGGFAHVWAKNISELHEYGQWKHAFYKFSNTGQNQINTRIRE